MKFRLSSLLFAIAVMTLLITTYLQYQHIDALKTELNADKKKIGLLQSELAKRELASMAN